MSARVKISFVKRHGWKNPVSFEVYHSEGSYVRFPLEVVTGAPVPLWGHGWEQAGFGHGRFGTGSFGWGQGGLVSGGFGFGRFGAGEFGYFNDVVEWITPRTYKDGLHSFGTAILGGNGVPSSHIQDTQVLITSIPADPKGLIMDEMTAGIMTLKWIGSQEND
ncbi:MAG: hypothetical protein WC975_07320 [Phycisphaerae bacterium]